jgi:hypothetical protein
MVAAVRLGLRLGRNPAPLIAWLRRRLSARQSGKLQAKIQVKPDLPDGAQKEQPKPEPEKKEPEGSGTEAAFAAVRRRTRR